MEGNRIYLDSSAIVKRYLNEAGTSSADEVFKNASARNTTVCFSTWNIGEVIGVFDKYERRGLIKRGPTVDRFMNELVRLTNTGSLETCDVSLSMILDAIGYVIRYHLYLAGAIQIASCKELKCGTFLTADRELHRVAGRESINSKLLI
jgi:predicted nucleic acid-binding protein